MFEIQSTLPDGGRADAVIQFPDRRLPIDAKFPREQVLALFESSDEAEIEDARHEFVRVMKAEAKRIKAYIQPENGTTDIALIDRKSTRLNPSHGYISYAVFCLKKKKHDRPCLRLELWARAHKLRRHPTTDYVARRCPRSTRAWLGCLYLLQTSLLHTNTQRLRV